MAVKLQQLPLFNTLDVYTCQYIVDMVKYMNVRDERQKRLDEKYTTEYLADGVVRLYMRVKQGKPIFIAVTAERLNMFLSGKITMHDLVWIH